MWVHTLCIRVPSLRITHTQALDNTQPVNSKTAMAINMTVLLLTAVCTAAATGETKQLPNEYIIVFPEPKIVTVDLDIDIEYGRFQCATRAGVLPLWIIDGLSAASIMSEPGFENLTYSTHHIPENGTFTLLYIPGFVETNNSLVRCAAVVDGKVVAFSDAVNFTVYCDWNCSVYADYEVVEDYTDTTGTTSRGTRPLPTDKGPEYTSISPHLIAGISAMVILGALLVIMAAALTVVTCVWVKRKRRIQADEQDRRRHNVYWSSSGGRNLLEESITSQDMKTAPKNK